MYGREGGLKAGFLNKSSSQQPPGPWHDEAHTMWRRRPRSSGRWSRLTKEPSFLSSPSCECRSNPCGTSILVMSLRRRQQKEAAAETGHHFLPGSTQRPPKPEEQVKVTPYIPRQVRWEEQKHLKCRKSEEMKSYGSRMTRQWVRSP